MGKEIVRVPPGFQHPSDAEGFPKPGAHLEHLYYMSETEKTCYQIYENVTEGTPVSPIFDSKEEMEKWLISKGTSECSVKQFLDLGHSPSLVIDERGSGDKGLKT